MLNTVWLKLFTVYHELSDSKETLVNQFVVNNKLELTASKFCFVDQKLLLTDARHVDNAFTVFDRLYVVLLVFKAYNETLFNHVTVAVQYDS